MLRSQQTREGFFLLSCAILLICCSFAQGRQTHSRTEVEPYVLTAPGQANDLAWGYNLELQGDTLIVAAADIASDEDEPDRGQIWKLIYSDDEWQYHNVLESPAAEGARFGYSLALADSIMIVGASEDENPDGLRTGAAYIYYRDEDGWELRHRFQPDLLSEGARFGHSVAADSGRVLVSAVEQPGLNDLDRAGAVFGYDLIRNPEKEPVRTNLNVSLPSERERLGWALDMHGKWAVVTTKEGGLAIGPRNRAFVFEQSTINTGWTARETFHRNQSNWVHFGSSAAISEHTVFVGHPREQYQDSENGVAYFYEGFNTDAPFDEGGFIPPSAPQSFSNHARDLSTHGDQVIVLGTFVVDQLRRTGDAPDGYSWEFAKSFSSDGGETRRFADAVDINDRFMVASGYDGPDQTTADRVIYWYQASKPTQAEHKQENRPTRVRLDDAYPNPFNAETILPFSLQKQTHARIEVFDLSGRKIAVLLDETLSPGEHTVRFDAGDLASGVYIYRLTADGLVFSRKMTLIK